jgi:hypothetical protein
MGLHRRTLFAAAVLLGGLLVPPAHASDQYAGFGCGMTAQGDGNFVATVTGGPWTVANDEGGTVSDVTITCTIQVNNPYHGGGGPSVTNTTSGNVGVVAGTTTFTAGPADSVYMCTMVEWTSPKGHTVLVLDEGGGLRTTLGDPVTCGFAFICAATGIFCTLAPTFHTGATTRD